MAIELAAFDLLPQHMSSFARGFSAALIATTFCYPLDTLRWSTPLTSVACCLALYNVKPSIVHLQHEFVRFAWGTTQRIAASHSQRTRLYIGKLSSCWTATPGPWSACRRQIQLQSATRVPARQVIRNVLTAEGVAGFYRGFLPNAAKNLPNKGA